MRRQSPAAACAKLSKEEEEGGGGRRAIWAACDGENEQIEEAVWLNKTATQGCIQIVFLTSLSD